MKMQLVGMVAVAVLAFSGALLGAAYLDKASPAQVFEKLVGKKAVEAESPKGHEGGDEAPGPVVVAERTEEQEAVELVSALAAKGDVEGAISRARESLGRDKPVTLKRLELQLMYGRLLERKGAASEAEAEYQRAMDQAMSAVPALGEGAENVACQACLAMVQLFRKSGREPLANSLTITMKSNLAKIKSSKERKR